MAHKDPEQKRAYDRAYYQQHREEIIARARQHQTEHAEDRAVYMETYAEEHREEMRRNWHRWKEKHPEALLEQRHRSQAKHRARSKKRREAFYQANRAEVRAKHATYYEEHREEILARTKQYAREHPEVQAAHQRRRRAQKASAPRNDLTAAQWEAIKDAFRHRCAYCGRRMQRLTQDHITPLSLGGSHTLHNVIPACRRCNSKKGINAPLLPVQPLLLTMT